MFAYELWFIDGSVLFDSGFTSFYEAEHAMLEIVDDSDIGIEYQKVMEVK